MISPAEALRLILDHSPVLGRETIALEQAVGRVLAEEIRASSSLPPFDNSAMDGYAVRAEDVAQATADHPVELEVIETVRAGASAGYDLPPGKAARIMTGAPMPAGADCVVMQEQTLVSDSGRVKIPQPTRAGKHVRVVGEDVREGDALLSAGCRLRPYEIALLAAQGHNTVCVVAAPRVAVLATGDELLPAESPLSRGKIRNANGPALTAALTRWGIPVVNMGIVGDDPHALARALSDAMDTSDVVLMSGGVSVGEFDHTRALFPTLGIHEIFWRTAIKPGKPLLFGVHEGRPGGRKLVFGLPGNPIAAIVCLEEFVRPVLEKLQGQRPGHASYHLRGQVLNDYPKPVDRQQYLFCRARPSATGYELSVIRPQGSAMLGMAAQANALAVAPIGVSRVCRGDVLSFRWLK